MSIRVTVCESQGLDQQGLDKQPQCLFHVAKHEIKHPKQHSVKHVTFNKTLHITFSNEYPNTLQNPQTCDSAGPLIAECVNSVVLWLFHRSIPQ